MGNMIRYDIKNLIRLGLVKCKNREFNEGMDLLLKSLYLLKKTE